MIATVTTTVTVAEDEIVQGRATEDGMTEGGMIEGGGDTDVIATTVGTGEEGVIVTEEGETTRMIGALAGRIVMTKGKTTKRRTSVEERIAAARIPTPIAIPVALPRVPIAARLKRIVEKCFGDRMRN
mmetsp:Transcript_14321/g.27057  ORF Transcript_14321/g.27057 Transcript_14321/m.27057 type:complete len:128 (-) Transcript_14321:88-471(-)